MVVVSLLGCDNFFCIRPKYSDFRGFGVIAKFVIKNSCLI